MPAQPKTMQLDGHTSSEATLPITNFISLIAPLDKNFIKVRIHKTDTRALIDTGACISCISKSMLQNTFPKLTLNPPIHKHVAGVGGEILQVLGMVDIPVKIGDNTFNTTVHVFQKLHHHLILGRDFLEMYEANIKFRDKTVTLNNTNTPLLKERQPIGIVRSASSIIIPPESGSFIPVKVSRAQTTYIALLDPITPMTQGGALVARCTVKVENGRTVCQVVNPTSAPIQILAGKRLALSHPIKLSDIAETNDSLPSISTTSPLHTPSEQEKEQALKNVQELNINLDDTNLTSEQKLELKMLIGRNRDVFALNMSELGVSHSFHHTIDTGDAPPQRQQYYRTSPANRLEQEIQIKEMLQNDIIEPSDALWQSPVVLVKKKSGEYRFAVDYRRVNSVTKQISQPLPRLESMFDAIGEARPNFFSTLDMSSGFWQMALDPETKHKSTFTCQMGNFNFKRMPFGLVNAPASYTIMMNKVLQGLTWKFLLCYMDDILIYSQTFEEHLVHLDQVFKRLREANLKLKPSKCHFATEKVLYLGHFISSKGIHVNEDKIKAVKDFPRPKTVRKLRGFLGLCSYYKRFVPNFAKIAAPLYQLLKKDVTFSWDTEKDHSFANLKKLLCTAPVLTHPDFSKEFILTTDASNEGVGYVLSQIGDDGNEHPLSYGGRSLRGGEPKYNTTELECLAIVEGLRANHIYLANKKFKLLTDHSALQWLRSIKPTNGRLHRWAMCISSYQCDIVHKPGATNKVADALSRCSYPEQPATPADDFLEQISVQNLNSISLATKSKVRPAKLVLEYEDQHHTTISEPVITVSEIFPLDLSKAQQECPDFELIYKYLDSNQLPSGRANATRIIAESDQYILDEGILYHIFVPRTKGIPKEKKIIRQLALPAIYRKEALEAYHDSLFGGGHFGFDRTYQCLRQKYYWPRMYKMVLDYVKSCEACQKSKRSQTIHKAPLTNMPIAEKFGRWHIDFLGPLTEAEDGSKYILLVVDSLTRWPEAFATKTTDSKVIADILYREIFSRYGAPKVLVSDRGQNFLSKLITALCEIFSVKRYHTSSYHPQTNSTCERLNSTLEQAIRAYCNESHKDWPTILPGILMSFRRSPSTHSTQYSPYYLTFGCDMYVPFDNKLIPKKKLPKATKTYIQELKNNLDIANEVASENTILSQEKSKQYYDKTSKSPDFKLGDKVLLSVKKVIQGKCKKFQPKYEGPFFIVKIGPNYTYKLSRTPDGQEGRAFINANRIQHYNDPNNRILPMPQNEVNTNMEVTPSQTNENAPSAVHPSQPQQSGSTTNNTDTQGGNWLPVDRILGTRKWGKTRYYRVKFKGETPTTWIPSHDIAEPLLIEYHRFHTNEARVRKTMRGKQKRVVFH